MIIKCSHIKRDHVLGGNKDRKIICIRFNASLISLNFIQGNNDNSIILHADWVD